MRTATKRKIGIVDGLGNRKVTVSACLELVLAQVPGMMDQVLLGLTLAAGLQADKPAQKTGFRPELKPVIQQLVNQRDSLRNAFSGQVRVLSYGGLADAGSRPLVRFEDIQLLDVHELDQSIELARVLQELDFAVAEALPRLNALMSTVMGWINVQPNINPLRPELFAKALRDTMAAHVSIAEVRSEILASAGRASGGLPAADLPGTVRVAAVPRGGAGRAHAAQPGGNCGDAQRCQRERDDPRRDHAGAVAAPVF
jgi:hypothetical protein